MATKDLAFLTGKVRQVDQRSDSIHSLIPFLGCGSCQDVGCVSSDGTILGERQAQANRGDELVDFTESLIESMDRHGIAKACLTPVAPTGRMQFPEIVRSRILVSPPATFKSSVILENAHVGGSNGMVQHRTDQPDSAPSGAGIRTSAGEILPSKTTGSRVGCPHAIHECYGDGA